MKLNRFSEESDGRVSLSLTVGSLEDIWHLYNLLIVGDDVRTSTQRKVVREGAGGSTAEKRRITLTICVTNLEYEPQGVLRVTGTNMTESEYVRLHAHHTSTIGYDPPQRVDIVKAHWDSASQACLKEACDEGSSADTAALIMGLGSAALYLINGSMTILKAKIKTGIAKKKRGSATARDDSVRGFYDQIGDALLLHVKPELIKCLLVASSGQLRDELMAHLQTKLQRDDCKPALRQLMTAKDKFVLVQISSNASLRETLALPEVQKRMDSARGSDDLKAWTRFQEVINTDPDFAAYGVQYVFTAHHEHHAIELLLLTDAVFRGEARQRTFYTAFVDDIKEYGGQVVILSSKHVVAEQLHAMGDIAAVLRLPLPDLDTQVVPDPNFVAASDEVTAYVAARKKIHMAAAATAMGTASASLVSSPVNSTPGPARGFPTGSGSAMGTPMPSNTF